MSMVRGPNPIWSEFNLTGAIFDDTYYAFFLTNTLPYLPLAVFQDPNGLVPYSDPIEFQANGTLPNNLYGDPTLVYRIEFRQGPNQTSPLIGNPIENYIFGSGGGTPSSEGANTTTNMITDPQFADIYFTSPLSIALAGTYNIAPGWQLILTGSGTATITQVPLAGDNVIEGNPPYALRIAAVGWATAKLIQTFSNNGAIFGGGSVALAFTALATGSSQVITAFYTPSNGSPTQLFPGDGTSSPPPDAITTGTYLAYSGFNTIPPSSSTQSGPSAYVQLVFNLQGTGTIDLTNIQLVGQSAANFYNATNFPIFQQQTYQRTVDQEFNVYKQPLSYKQIPSYLVGWDFPLNPAQFTSGKSLAAQAVGANKSYYAWDQTILFQSADSGITVSGGAEGDLKLLAAPVGGTQMAVIQYLPGVQAQKILNDIISVNLSAISHVAATGTIKCTISLWYTKGSALPSTIGSNLSIVLTLDANGKPATFNNPTGGTWIEVPPLNGQEAVALVASSSTTNFNDYAFNGWWNLAGNSDIDSATFFAIVIGTAAITHNDYLRINSVGLCSGSIATRPAPKTQDEALRECQYYYEKSYAPGVIPGTVTVFGRQTGDCITIFNPGTASAGYLQSFQLDFSQTKNINPVMTFYGTNAATVDRVYVVLLQNGTAKATANPTFSSTWDITTISQDRLSAVCLATDSAVATWTDAAAANGDETKIYYHYTADSRLGQ